MSPRPSILIVGCGSIGARHARNFAKIADVSICDMNSAKTAPLSEELGRTSFNDINEALAYKPDGVVIALPTHLHFNAARQALESGAYVLVEKPICQKLDDAQALVSLGGDKLFVVSNMRYHDAVKTLRAGLSKIGTPYFARVQFGNYLPNMRPGVEYSTLYVARRDTGGGVIMDCIHEIDYLQSLFGRVTNTKATCAKLSDLDIEAEDYAALSLTHETGVRSEVHFDYLQQVKQRGCEIIGSAGTVIWRSVGKNPEHCKVELFTGGTWETLLDSTNLEINRCYEDMTRAFCDAIAGEHDNILSTAQEGLSALKVVYDCYEQG